MNVKYNDISIIKTILLLLHILYWALPIIAIAIVPTKYLYYLYYDLNELIMNEIINSVMHIRHKKYNMIETLPRNLLSVAF